MVISLRNSYGVYMAATWKYTQRFPGESRSPLSKRVLQFCCDSPETSSLRIFKFQPYHDNGNFHELLHRSTFNLRHHKILIEGIFRCREITYYPLAKSWGSKSAMGRFQWLASCFLLILLKSMLTIALIAQTTRSSSWYLLKHERILYVGQYRLQ